MKVFIGMEASGATRRAMQARGHFTISCDLLPADDGAQSPFETGIGGHIQGDVFDTLDDLKVRGWWPDLAIFHPTCTFHTLAAAWAFNDPDYDRYVHGYHQQVKAGTLVGAARRAARDEAEADVERIKMLPIRRKVIENPRGTIPARTSLGKPLQVIHPYQLGDDASKATCLWFFDENGNPDPSMVLRIDPAKRVAGRMVCDDCGSTSPASTSTAATPCRYCGAPAVRKRERWSNQTDKGQNRLTPGPDRWKLRSETYPGIAGAFADQLPRSASVIALRWAERVVTYPVSEAA